MHNWKLAAADVLNAGPVVPVIVINKLEQAVPLAKALVKGGIRVLEVTLRTECAIDAIRLIANEVPEAMIGAGTVINALNNSLPSLRLAPYSLLAQVLPKSYSVQQQKVVSL